MEIRNEQRKLKFKNVGGKTNIKTPQGKARREMEEGQVARASRQLELKVLCYRLLFVYFFVNVNKERERK